MWGVEVEGVGEIDSFCYRIYFDAKLFFYHARIRSEEITLIENESFFGFKSICICIRNNVERVFPFNLIYPDGFIALAPCNTIRECKFNRINTGYCLSFVAPVNYAQQNGRDFQIWHLFKISFGHHYVCTFDLDGFLPLITLPLQLRRGERDGHDTSVMARGQGIVVAWR